MAAVVVLLGSADSAAVAALLVPAAPPAPAPPARQAPGAVPHEAELPVLVQVPPGRGVLVLARVPPEPVLLHLLPLLLPQVVVESEVPLHLQGRQSFSAATARSSPPTVQPTCERAPSTR